MMRRRRRRRRTSSEAGQFVGRRKSAEEHQRSMT
jgi:hypothetical protein